MARNVGERNEEEATFGTGKLIHRQYQGKARWYGSFMGWRVLLHEKYKSSE